jgi:hypothetical protein
LGAVTAVLTATPRFDAQEATQLNPFFFGPMLSMNLARVIQKIEKRLAVERRKRSKGFGRCSNTGNHSTRVAKKTREVKNVCGR